MPFLCTYCEYKNYRTYFILRNDLKVIKGGGITDCRVVLLVNYLCRQNGYDPQAVK